MAPAVGHGGGNGRGYRRRRSYARWIVSAAAGLYLVFCTVLGVFLADIAVMPGRRGVDAADLERTRARVQPLGAHVTDVAITAADRVTLRGWLFTPARPNGHAVIGLHGVSDNRTSIRGHADLLVTHGYTVLTPDARGHGASGGDRVTYGVRERDDIARWIAWLRTHVEPSTAGAFAPGASAAGTSAAGTAGCIHGFGSSMGGAQLLQTVDRPDLLCSAAVESAFATFREISFDRVGQAIGVGDWLGRTVLRPAVEVGLIAARVRYGIDLTQANPSEHLRRARVPVLVIHGLADTNIPPRHARFLQSSNPGITVWLVPGAHHGAAWAAEPTKYPERLLAFFAAHQDAGRVRVSPASLAR